ncbi:HD family hydrolase [Treponema sp. OMZ 855]|uniref:HD domain-containing protein n=1 Tax=Treponema sp. OMZ 855 TaxID=1643512 RepID=UPI0020A46EC5|nr:HD domain-containing protein [Treponema sp. OMZ 855]UTC51864.1 HD domain-containing protein [Treponema sp. OMZ 855]
MFSKEIVCKLFEAFSIQRWNDLVRPFDIVEMDKTAEKMFLSFIIGKYEEKNGRTVNWLTIINHSFFELLRRIALCDMKSPVQRIIRSEYPEEYKKLNRWVLDKYKTIITDPLFLDEFAAYLFDPVDPTDISFRVLRAAHKYSAMRELDMIRMVNEPFRLTEIDKCLETDIADFMDLKGVQLLTTRQQPYYFITEIEKLRFQTRWNQTPRVPATTVLGHSYFVAALVFLMSRTLKLAPHRLSMNFFAALFHDLPEAVTRDIISPVKQATDRLPEVVKHIEDEIVAKELLPLMDDFYREEVLYFIQDEFENRITLNGEIRCVTSEELNTTYAAPEFCGIDGKLIRAADHIAAFVEADSSINFGIRSEQLEEGRANILHHYGKNTVINGFSLESFFASYR